MAALGISNSLGVAVPPNMSDYEAACREFSWEVARRELTGLPGGRGLNIAHDAVDRHATNAQAEQVALVGFGSVSQRPLVVDGMCVARSAVTATLAADHRALDRHRAGLYLQAIADALQQPGSL